MYQKNNNQEILAALQRLDERLDALETRLRETEEAAQAHARQQEDASSASAATAGAKKQPEEKHLLWDLTRAQYELSNEFFSGVAHLKALIAEGERGVVEAKGQYQK